MRPLNFNFNFSETSSRIWQYYLVTLNHLGRLKSDINLLENTQHRATRFILDINKLSYHERFRLHLPTFII